MTEEIEVPVVSGLLTAMLLIAGSGITLIGSLGLLRLRTFYERSHAPTLGTTLGTMCVVLASMIHFWTLGGRLTLHELLIIAFVTVTTPISLMVLLRAAVLRDGSDSESTSAGRQ